METIETRVDRLESLEAFRRLKHAYCRACDDGYDADAIAALFWDDAVWDAGPEFGRHEGPAAIAAFFRGVSSAIVWARHLVTNELLEADVANDRGTGEYQILQPCTFAGDDGPRAAWLVGRYEEVYERRDGEWRYASLRAEIEFITPYELGWHKATSLD
jgi:ketosteroid isomerase-like protein